MRNGYLLQRVRFNFKMAYRDKEKANANKRKNYHKNKEKNRARNRKNKRKQRQRRATEINEYQRKRYAKHRASEARKQNARRIRRLPYIGLRKAVLDCERGALTFDGLIELLRERLAWSDGVLRTPKGLGKNSG